jgi:hypothetical protein
MGNMVPRLMTLTLPVGRHTGAVTYQQITILGPLLGRIFHVEGINCRYKHDDIGQIFINGTSVYNNASCCTSYECRHIRN